DGHAHAVVRRAGGGAQAALVGAARDLRVVRAVGVGDLQRPAEARGVGGVERLERLGGVAAQLGAGVEGHAAQRRGGDLAVGEALEGRLPRGALRGLLGGDALHLLGGDARGLVGGGLGGGLGLLLLGGGQDALGGL